MYPDQPTPPQAPLPTDYLNQIAPQAPKKSLFHFGIKQVLFAGIALIILVIIISAVVNSVVASRRDPVEHLAANLNATQTIATNAQQNLKSSKLRSVNSNLKIYMTNTTRDMAAPLLSAGVTTAKISTSVTKAEATTDLSAKLEDARLNGTFDATYSREMAYRLGNLLTLMNQIYGSTSSSSLKTFIKSSYDNLKPTQDSFASYSSAADN